MTLKVSNFTRYPLMREDARRMLSALGVPPSQIDFSEVRSISHCFAHELVSNLDSTDKLMILNASPYVERIISSVMP